MNTDAAPAISIKNPWAWAIVAGLKDIENRTWRTNHRGPILIHAGKATSAEGVEFIHRLGLEVPEDAPTGGIVGIADLVDCTYDDSDSEWAIPGHWHWRLANARALPFEPVKGQLGLFRV